ncbi:MAG: hypothetical protein NC407_10415 [Lachnoclostridium sp.]|nr:hypothetical protein [Lachnoclostridium sp.]
MNKKKILLVKCIPWITETVSCMLIIFLYLISRHKYGYAVLENNRFIYFSFVNQAGCFALGASLYFEQKSNSVREHTVIHTILCIFYAILLPIVFFSKWKIAFVTAPYIMGLFTYYLLKCMLVAEYQNTAVFENKKIFHLLKTFGKHSYYIYLVHVLFVWSMPLKLQKLLTSSGMPVNSNFLYMILIVPIFIGSYYTAVLFQKILDKISEKIRNNIDKSAQKG